MKKSIKIFAIVLLIISLSVTGIAPQNQNQDGNKIIGRALIEKNTGRLVEYQSGAYRDDGSAIELGTLTQNAINGGLNPSNLKEKYVTQADYDSLMNATKENDKKHYADTFQQETNIGNIGVVKLPLVTELNDSYPVGGVVIYTDNLLYYKAADGWHHIDGSKVR